jgi:predicted permease
MYSPLQPLRLALRRLLRERSFTATVVLTLALCLGANAAVYTVVHSVLLRPLPFDGAGRLVSLSNAYPGAGVAEGDNSVPDYYDRRTLSAFDEVALYGWRGRTAGAAEGSQRMSALESTPSLLAMVGARALRGRLFEARDGEDGAPPTVVLSEGVWRREFGGRDDAVGSDLRLNGVPHEVIGVLPRSFTFIDPGTELWLPLAFSPEERSEEKRHSNNYQMVARLAPGATLEQARRQVDALNVALVDRSPARQALVDAGYRTNVRMLRDQLVGPLSRTLYLLWGGVAFVLLIGAVNVTNLALVRATARAREFATRRALGAGTRQLAGQLFCEGLLLSGFAGGLGLALAAALVGAISTGATGRVPRAEEIALGGAAVLFTLALTLGVAALLALLPLALVRGPNLARAMAEEGRGGTAGRGSRLGRRALITAQVAFAFVLLVGAGLLLASFRSVLAVEPGFESRGLLTARLTLPPGAYGDDDRITATFARLLAGARSVPGVAAAAFASGAPFSGSYSDSVILPDGFQARPGESIVSPSQNVVTAGYFAALGIPVLRGRAIDERDTWSSGRVVVVDERLAQLFWPGQDAVGRRVFQPQSAEDTSRPPGPDTQWVTVVGVVGAIKERSLEGTSERAGVYYYPASQSPLRTMTLVARTTVPPSTVISALRREVATVDPELPLYGVLTMEERLRDSVAGRRAAMLVALGFGAIALLLATVGIYGMLAYQVAQRRREIGVRMALGSDARRVFALVLKEGALLLALGTGLGLAGAVGLRRILGRELYGVDPLEPSVLAAVALLFGAVALVACALPARRAAKTDPVVALSE